MRGFDFHRQKPLLNYIVDFFCHELMLVIEIDGDSHDHKYEDDLQRQKTLEEIGISFIRFDDLEVKHDIYNVIRTIEGWVDEHSVKTHS